MKFDLYLTAASVLLAGGAMAQMSDSVSDSTTATVTADGPSRTTEACQVASKIVAAALETTPADPRIPADIAYDCLKSVPLGKDQAIELVDDIKPYLEWQSDAAYKADPPTTYEFPAYDMFKALDKVRENLVNDVYENEYDFQSDLYMTVFAAGHDGHFTFYPDLLTKVFEFGRPYPLVSVSEDGKALPMIKLYEDVVRDPKTASTVVKINGENAIIYLQNYIDSATFNQNKDAAYNSLFYNKAAFGSFGGSGYFANYGRTRFIYNGPNTTLTFDNGTEFTFDNYASVLSDLGDVVDGASMYKKFCNGTSTEDSSTSGSSAPVKLTSVPGFPEHPVDITDDAVVSCYFLEGDGVDNTMVLSVLAFESASAVEFQAVTQNCLAQAKAAGKTKLVVDLSANGGGYILLGYDFFRQLFPKIQEKGFSRWKANDAYNTIGEIFSDAVDNFNPYTSKNETLIYDYESWFNWRYDLDTEGKPFTSFADKFGPQKFQDTNYTSLMKWNFNDNLTTTSKDYGLGIEISGYGSRANLTQPFAAEDIVIVYDGFCGSTCTIAAEFLDIQAGVKSVALGGRPKTGLIQGVGGIKGSQVLAFSDINYYANMALDQAKTEKQRTELKRYTELPIKRSSYAAVNSRDAIRPSHVKDGVPAQYVVEESDCRLYYTAEMAVNVTAVWKAAANAAFNGAKCNAGNFTTKSTTKAINSRVDARNRDRRSALLPSGVDEASLEKRANIADLKEAELARKSAKSAEELKRFEAMYNQKIV